MNESQRLENLNYTTLNRHQSPMSVRSKLPSGVDLVARIRAFIQVTGLHPVAYGGTTLTKDHHEALQALDMDTNWMEFLDATNHEYPS